MLTFAELKKNLKKDFSSLKKVKVAILADSATQLYAQALKGQGYSKGINYEIFEADYDQIDRQILDHSSELYSFQPEFVIIFQSSQKLLKSFYKKDVSDRATFADEQIQYLKGLLSALNSKLSSKVIYFNFAEINDGVFGNYSNKIESSFTYQLRKINFLLIN